MGIGLEMLQTGAQLRAARALVLWSQQELADAANLHVNTIAAWERRGAKTLNASLDVIVRVAKVLEDAGVLFIDGNGHGPGVVLKKPTAEPAAAPKVGAKAQGSSKKSRSRRTRGPLAPSLSVG